MTLVKYKNGLHNPLSFGGLVDKYFDDTIFGYERKNPSFIPQVDIAETDEAFELSFALPGLKKEDIKIDLQKGTLTISGERQIDTKEEGKSYKSVETSFGTFSRSFHLPEDIAEDKITAKHENGVLEIVVPKDKKKVAVKSIKIG